MGVSPCEDVRGQEKQGSEPGAPQHKARTATQDAASQALSGPGAATGSFCGPEVMLRKTSQGSRARGQAWHYLEPDCDPVQDKMVPLASREGVLGAGSRVFQSGTLWGTSTRLKNSRIVWVGKDF